MALLPEGDVVVPCSIVAWDDSGVMQNCNREVMWLGHVAILPGGDVMRQEHG